MNVRQELFDSQDLKYRDFHAKLIPNVDKEYFIGVRIPVIRDIAKRAAKENAEIVPKYYEEIMVQGMAIGYSKCEIAEYISRLEKFVPLIDNWAICDCVCSTLKFTKKYQNEMWDFVNRYQNGSEYEVRFLVVMLMNYFLTDTYIDKTLDILTSIHREEYYINMAIAWALATALAKYEAKVLPIIERKALDTFVHNKTIQKARESYRIRDELKAYLKSLKKAS
ncbi:MAG: DNA alkylation repair protein [Clostridium sp.]|nr:DNA alkylation repair protein [Clostridium sp.]